MVSKTTTGWAEEVRCVVAAKVQGGRPNEANEWLCDKVTTPRCLWLSAYGLCWVRGLVVVQRVDGEARGDLGGYAWRLSRVCRVS